MSEMKHYLANGAETAPEPAEALEFTRKTQAKMIDLKFTDLLGTWQHMFSSARDPAGGSAG